jgi:hypothetical protein
MYIIIGCVSLFIATQFKNGMKLQVDNCDDQGAFVFPMPYFQYNFPSLYITLFFAMISVNSCARVLSQLHFNAAMNLWSFFFFPTCVFKQFEISSNEKI